MLSWPVIKISTKLQLLIATHYAYQFYTNMRLLHISLIVTFFAYFSKVHTSHIFPHKLAFLREFLTLFAFLLPISIRFHYLDHLVTNRMAPSTCPDPCGTRWGSWFPAILYHISAAHLVFMRSDIFLKCRIKMTCLKVASWHSNSF